MEKSLPTKGILAIPNQERNSEDQVRESLYIIKSRFALIRWEVYIREVLSRFWVLAYRRTSPVKFLYLTNEFLLDFWWSLPSPKIRLPGLHPRPQNHLSLVAGGVLARDKKRDRWIFTNSTLFSFPKYPVVDHLRKPFDQITFRKLNTGFRKTFLGESSITKHMNTTPVRVKLLFQIPSVKPALSQSWKPIQSNHMSPKPPFPECSAG